MEKIFDEILASIKRAKKVLIISHVNPDGDTLGSMCALKIFIGSKADMLVQTRPGQEIPEIYEFLPHIGEAKNLRNVEDIYDLVIAVDVASVERMVLKGRDIFQKCPATINIDHHRTNPAFGKINLIKPEASSCGEILYDLMTSASRCDSGAGEEPEAASTTMAALRQSASGNIITKDIADCLYVALMTDTGGFRYSNTTQKTLKIASALMELGADCADLAQKVYDSKSKAMVMFQAYCVSNTVFLEDNKIAYTIVRNADMERFGAKHEYTEGICETIRSIKTVEIACVIKENDSLAGGTVTKVSLRTKNIDAIKIVEKFKGGGHPRSAGCNINKPVDEAVELLLKQIQRVLSDQ